MRGADEQSGSMFSYVSLEERVPADHPLRAIRRITDRALERLSPRFGTLYVQFGRPSIPPEKLLRALLLQILYTVRSERMLMEQLNYNLLFRWFVGLSMDDAVWDVTVFTKNRERLVKAEVARQFFALVVEEAKALDCCRMSTSRWTARCWRPGRVTKASRPGTRRRRTGLAPAAAIPWWISAVNDGRM